MITEINRPLLALLRKQVDDALAPVAAKTGIHLKVGNISFTASTATFKVQANLLDASGSVKTKEQENLRYLAPMLGITEAHLGKEFILGSKRFKLDGYKTSRTSKPFLIKEVSTDKLYVASTDQINRVLGIKE